MSDEIQVEGKEYISSKRASDLTSYAQDYIGQLARKGYIDAHRIGGLWYVSMESLSEYKQKAADYKPEPSVRAHGQDLESFVAFDGKDYISASRASEITTYNQDYVGQLARSGKILSRQVGNRWYVEKESLLAHKTEKDSLLAAVQAESVGIYKQEKRSDSSTNPDILEESELLQYTEEESELIPRIVEKESATTEQAKREILNLQGERPQEHEIPIHVVSRNNVPKNPIRPNLSSKYISHKRFQGNVSKERSSNVPGILILTGVAVLSLGFVVIKTNMGPLLQDKAGTQLSAIGSVVGHSTGGVINAVEGAFESLFAPELIYQRSK